MELNDTIEVGLEETPNRFPYTKAFIAFLEVLNEYGINKNINILSEER